METDEGKTVLMPPHSIGRLLVQTGNATTALCNGWLSEDGLSLPQWVMLSALWRRDGLTLTELAGYSGSLMPAASRLVERMEGAGLVERRPDPRSRRSMRVHLTRHGRGLDRLSGFHDRVNATVLEGFSAEETATLFALLERAAANVQRAQSDAV